MSLEQSIDKLCAAVEANTVALNASLSSVQPAPVPAPVPAPELTMQDLNSLMQDKAAQMGDGGAAIFKMLNGVFGVNNISTLEQTQYAAVIDAVKGLS